MESSTEQDWLLPQLRRKEKQEKTPYKLNKDDKTLWSGSNNDNAITGNISKKLLTFYIFNILIRLKKKFKAV
jgi:hypothetical protein